MTNEAIEEKDLPASAKHGHVSSPTRILWDDSGMRSAYANVTHVTGGREEIILLFGMNQSWHGEKKEINVAISERIVMNPYAAKRFSLSLTKAIENYEKQFGEVELEIRRPQGVTLQ